MTESLKTVVEVGAGDGKVLSREQVGALLLATSKSSQNREKNPIILPIVKTRKLREVQ